MCGGGGGGGLGGGGVGDWGGGIGLIRPWLSFIVSGEIRTSRGCQTAKVCLAFCRSMCLSCDYRNGRRCLPEFYI